MTDWLEYYRITSNRAPRDTLLQCLKLFKKEGEPNNKSAIDLGFGSGNDTLELLNNNWNVLAVDSEENASKFLLSRISNSHQEKLQIITSGFENVTYPKSSLINASYSLPFCKSENFKDFWSKLIESLVPGGRICGQLFGIEDQWNKENRENTTFLSLEEFNKLFKGLELEFFKEVKEDGKTASGIDKFWHIFHFVAKKRSEEINQI
ncbi:MAG: class I SAM-dependent methyltransferase [Candidatus Heimdallarchaeota archaeon]|nr:class I SAM-dependent methyltransferase [Candidatus Heimdallarchaeota archaeon]